MANMTVFVIIESQPPAALEGRIKAQFPDDYYRLADGQWLVSAKMTAVDLSNSLGLKPGSGLGGTLVVSISSYYGLHSPEVWDWIKTKMEAA